LKTSTNSGNILTATMSQTQTNTFKGHLKPDIHLKKWVDFSSKYGLGYLLSNGMFGVFFNDSTKILLYSDGKYRP
jgi:polo-like kinase 1